ncbi:hypothetical protein DPEC_G00075820 [Dallia pectoralis]|uniref:Uncharacterized protein n=1 Tax=Dallia pectoralis TaxID=75939 RepID=A0ACC2H4N4_DALPE|nr:hypothetical protein DPEC_G00075820 [Dallia pectoralis]
MHQQQHAIGEPHTDVSSAPATYRELGTEPIILHTPQHLVQPGRTTPIEDSRSGGTHLQHGQFTDIPSNLTVKEGQNIEMACAFQSGTASVYLEIQWWFIRAPEEPSNSEEEEDGDEEEAYKSIAVLQPLDLRLPSPSLAVGTIAPRVSYPAWSR